VLIALGGLGAIAYVQAKGREAADEQRKIAVANAEQATLERKRADGEAEAATKRADEVLRLSAFQKLDDLIAEASLLWPAYPGNIAAYEAWLTRADALVGELPLHAAKLAELRARARPWSAEEQAAHRATSAVRCSNPESFLRIRLPPRSGSTGRLSPSVQAS
jgi:hypothetical protein